MENISKYRLLVCCTVFILLLAVAGRSAESVEEEEERQREADMVKKLPGQPPVKFRHFAGYVKLRPNEDKALFYWFFEAQSEASLKPLVLWLNGGPGCSSVAYGAAQELGPFLVRSNNTQLTLNKFSWNRVANMLFLEAPVGVGFSYSNNSNDLRQLGDGITANDSYAFLVNWFKRFPSFKSHHFYIAGESYAGHYVPQLAELIYERNKGANKDSYINLKGFMIGNAVINDETDTKGLVEFAWSHAIISDQLYVRINKECDFLHGHLTLQCSEALKGFMEAYADIDIYSIYSPVCLNYDFSNLLVPPHRLFSNSQEMWNRGLPSGYDPCTQDYVEQYFNKPEVQMALHANTTKIHYPYTLCSGVIKGWNDSPDTVLPILKKLLNAGLRIWVYSGDTDGRVPVTSTRYSINKMGVKVNEEWRTWFHKNQAGGWVETYEGGLTLATVRGAGHQVPLFAPQQSLSLFTHFLHNNPLPLSRF